MELRNGVFKMMMILWGVVPIVLLVLTVIYLYKKINSAVKYFGAKEDVSYSSVNDSKIKTKYRIISIGIFALLIVPVVFFKMTWIIVLLHLFVLLLVTDLVVWIIEKIGHKINSTTFQRIYKSGIIAIVITAIMITYGYFNIFKVIDTQYTVYTEKNIRSEGYKILVLSDLHTGLTLNGEQLEQKVAEMSYQNPDVVILDGDIVDESTTFEQMQEAFSILSKISNRYGIYYVYGNHDKNAYTSKPNYTPEQLKETIISTGINILEDTTQVINNELVLIGRADKGDMVNVRKDISELVDGLNSSMEWIVLDHQPADYKLCEQNGADIIISGHTHAGQIWPIGFLSSVLHLDEMNYGYKVNNNMTAIVTSGIAGWGFPLRTSKHSEYLVINIVNK